MTRTLSPITLGLGFLAGAFSVLVFHQGMVLALHLAGEIPRFPWSMRPVAPLSVPALLNSMFWGGLWGLTFVLAVETFAAPLTWWKGIVFGLIGPWLLGNGLLVPLVKGGALFFGLSVPRMMIGALIGAAFGLGWSLLYGFMRSRAGMEAATR